MIPVRLVLVKWQNKRKESPIKITRSFIKIINLKTHKVEVSGELNDDKYEFRIIVSSMFEKPKEFHGYLSQKFIEEQINKNIDVNYLDILSADVADKHLKDILLLKENGIIANANVWFLEAKKELVKKGVEKRKKYIPKIR